MTGTDFEPGSFRDRNSRVFYRDGAVLRCLSEKALKEWEALSSTRFFPQLMAAKKLIYTERVENAGVLPPVLRGTWAGLLKHEVLPFVSYPYEWCFGQLKDAALLHLELLLAALEEDMILQDSSAFNVQWKGAKPVFIDIPSFKGFPRGEPWIGYRQFCQMFLYPLLLQAYRGIPFQPWLRGSIDGIEPEHCYRLMSLLDLVKPGVFSHVYLQAKMQARYAATQREVKADIQAAGFSKEMIVANVRRLTRLIQGLVWRPTDSVWAGLPSQPVLYGI